MNENLSEQFKQYVAEQVKSGLYNNASQVIREALRADIDAACKQLDDGRAVQFDPKEMLNRVKLKSGQ